MSQKANEPHLTGLTDQEVLSSREKYGVNLLTPPKRPSMWKYDANKKFDLLNAVGEETPVTVIRNGKVHEIPRKDVVVGDIVILNTGEEVPADGTLLEAVSLQVNESSLTGELMVNKTTVEADFDEEATYPSNSVMRGTTITDGHGMMRVERVGDATEIGKSGK